MSERTKKVASLVRQTVAAELSLVPEAARLTVTTVDVSPDLRTCTVWIGVLAPPGDDARAEQLFKVALGARDQLQKAVARQLTTKFIPRVRLARDTGGEYAAEINQLISGL
ncbi:MAG TPA: ribosome-binding factor A [Candidatus Saccharimonadales bacterium]|nr:ribosome-binding factor A [Candidatus Saccharimonadales bacterium]